MTTKEPTGLATAQWLVMATTLGSIIAKVPEYMLGADSIDVYDPCWVVMRPDIYWINPEDKTVPPIAYNSEEAERMQYSIEILRVTDSNFIGDGNIHYETVELIECEGDMITEYIPINPNVNVNKSGIELNMSQIIYSYIPENQEDITEYVDGIMGRMPTKEVHDKQ